MNRVCQLLIGALVLGSLAAWAQNPPQPMPHAHGAGGPSYQQHYDARYSHNQYYPVHGATVTVLPRQPIVVAHPGGPYYYASGVWYRPAGVTFVVVPAPVGVYVPLLPAYYSTLWVGGAPYYYANDTYYSWNAAQNGYEVVAPPNDQGASTAPPPSDELFTYPQSGQTPEQQATDQYECHKWAVSQSGFDPTQSGGGASDPAGSARDNYQRALRACLEGRGYSVR